MTSGAPCDGLPPTRAGESDFALQGSLGSRPWRETLDFGWCTHVMGERLVIADGTEVPLRATASLARWNVNGTRLQGRWWRPTPGVHEIVAVLGARRSEPVQVIVSDANGP